MTNPDALGLVWRLRCLVRTIRTKWALFVTLSRARVGQAARMIVAFSISPSSGDETGGVSEAVAAAIRVVRESGLPNETNAMFTNIEGEWDEIMAVLKQAVDVVAGRSPRVSLVFKADIRPGYTGRLAGKVARVDELLSD